jgi:hypothetical protein
VAPRRLVPAHAVSRWEGQLRRAADAALDEMHGHVRAAMTAHGLGRPSALVAASRKKQAVNVATGVGLGLLVWNDAQWRGAVIAHIDPVAQQIGDAASTAAQAAVPTAATWGMPSSGPGIAATLTAGAIASGAYLGSRLNSDVSAADDPAQAADDVFDTAGDIVGGQLGASAQMAAESATSDVASYAAHALFGESYSGATKTWNAVGDDLTRPDHLDAADENVDIPINDPFDVGGEQLLYPGDPSGSDEQTINCRCWTTTDGIDPGIAEYGEPEPDEPGGSEQPYVGVLNTAGSTTGRSTTPVSYPT